MAVVDVGEGARAVLTRPGGGRVIAVYRRAAYLRLDGALVALVDGSVPSGPLHVRCTVLPRLREGQRVTCDGIRLSGGDWALRVDGPVWRPYLPDPVALADACRDPAVARGLTALVDGAEEATGLEASVRAGALEEVAAAVGGRGPGLTPAGDDLLAGVLLAARTWWGPDPAPRLDAVAAGVPTTEIARSFLAWAARGRCISPVHDWLTAVAAGRHDDAAGAARRLVAVGASSGLHLAAGLALGVGQLPRTASQMARAVPDPPLRHSAGRSPG